MQEKIDCNNINEIKEERNANSIYTGSATSCAYVQSSSNLTWDFHYLVKYLLQSLNHTGTILPLCSEILTT